MPTNLYFLFCESGHPEIFKDEDALLPPVQEWEFVGGNGVCVLDGPFYGQTGTVQSVKGADIIVNLDGDEANIKIVPHQNFLYRWFCQVS